MGQDIFELASLYLLISGGVVLVLALVMGKKTPKPEVKHGTLYRTTTK